MMKTHSTLPTGGLMWLLVIFAGTIVLAGLGIAAAWRWLRRWWWVAGMVVVLIVAAGIAFAQSGARGDGHPERHDWYRGLTKPGTVMSCCNALTSDGQGDCRPVRAFFDSARDRWRAMVDGRWEDVPPDVILPDHLNKEPLYAHACRSRGGTWYCFLKGGGGT